MLQALPIFLDRLVDPITAVVLSVTVVLIFGALCTPASLLWPAAQCSQRHTAPAGEIAPQALCSRYGLQIGSYSSWFVRGLILAVWPIAFPISKILDCVLGTEHGVSVGPRAPCCCVLQTACVPWTLFGASLHGMRTLLCPAAGCGAQRSVSTRGQAS